MTERCNYQWPDTGPDAGHNEWHECMRTPQHERMHVCQCGEVADPQPSSPDRPL